MATEGLRQRPGKGTGEDKDAARNELLREVSQGVPESVRPYAEKMIPAVVAAWAAGEAAIPYVLLARAKAEEGYKLLEPYHPQELFPALCGEYCSSDNSFSLWFKAKVRDRSLCYAQSSVLIADSCL